MSKVEKENRINSLAVTFLERQQIQPNIFADQIMRGYKEGYHQAEKDNELTWEDINSIKLIIEQVECDYVEQDKKLYTKYFYEEVLERFKNLKK